MANGKSISTWALGSHRCLNYKGVGSIDRSAVIVCLISYAAQLRLFEQVKDCGRFNFRGRHQKYIGVGVLRLTGHSWLLFSHLLKFAHYLHEQSTLPGRFIKGHNSLLLPYVIVLVDFNIQTKKLSKA